MGETPRAVALPSAALAAVGGVAVGERPRDALLSLRWAARVSADDHELGVVVFPRVAGQAPRLVLLDAAHVYWVQARGTSAVLPLLIQGDDVWCLRYALRQDDEHHRLRRAFRVVCSADEPSRGHVVAARVDALSTPRLLLGNPRLEVRGDDGNTKWIRIAWYGKQREAEAALARTRGGAPLLAAAVLAGAVTEQDPISHTQGWIDDGFPGDGSDSHAWAVSRWLAGFALPTEESAHPLEMRCYRLWQGWAATQRALVEGLTPSPEALESLAAYLPTPLAEAAFELASLVATRTAIEQRDAAVRLGEAIALFYLGLLNADPEDLFEDEKDKGASKRLTFRQLVCLLRNTVAPPSNLPEDREEAGEPDPIERAALAALEALEDLCSLRDRHFYDEHPDEAATAAVFSLVRGLVELDLVPLLRLEGDHARVFAGLAPRLRCLEAPVAGIGLCGVDDLLGGDVLPTRGTVPGDRWLVREGDQLRLCRMEQVEGAWVPAREEPLPEEGKDGEPRFRIPMPLEGRVLEIEVEGGLPALHQAVRGYDRAERVLCAFAASEEDFSLEAVERDARLLKSLLESEAAGRVVSLLRPHAAVFGELRAIRNAVHHALRPPRASPGQIAAFARRLHDVAEGSGWGQWRWSHQDVELPGVGTLPLPAHWVLKDSERGVFVYDLRSACYRDSANRSCRPDEVARRVGQPVSKWIEKTFSRDESEPKPEPFSRPPRAG